MLYKAVKVDLLRSFFRRKYCNNTELDDIIEKKNLGEGA